MEALTGRSCRTTVIWIISQARPWKKILQPHNLSSGSQTFETSIKPVLQTTSRSQVIPEPEMKLKEGEKTRKSNKDRKKVSKLFEVF